METGDVTESTEQGTSSEYVELPDATDEDIQAFLDGAEYREQQLENGLPDEPQQQTEQKDEQLEEEQDVPPQVQQKDIEAIRKQLEGLELLNKRRTSELSEVKRQLKEFRDRVSQNLDERFLESPTQAFAQARQAEMAQAKIQEIEAEEAALTNAHQAQVLLAHHVGTDGIDVEAIAEALQSDGMPPEFIQQFLGNPYKAALPETLIQLAKRAKAEKRIKEYESTLSQVMPYIQRLMEERKRLPSDVLRNVQSALRSSPQVTGSAGGTGQMGERPVEFASMSDQALEEFLRG
jgi:hypothetical protein